MTKHLAHFCNRGVCPGTLKQCGYGIFSKPHLPIQFLKCHSYLPIVTLCLKMMQSLNHPLLNAFFNLEAFNLDFLILFLKSIQPHDDTLPFLDLLLVLAGRLSAELLIKALFYSLLSPPFMGNLLHKRPRPLFDLIGEGFDVIGTSQRICHIGNACLIGQDVLCHQGHVGGLL